MTDTNTSQASLGYEDVFGKLIADPTSNKADLASHYEYNPQRWRLYKTDNSESNRLFPEYNSVSEYNHTGSHHELKPASGETIIFETAERFRYVVQYEFYATWAMFINQQLNAGDLIRGGLYDGADGWFFEHNGTHEPLEVDLVVLRGGSEVYRRKNTLGKNLTTKQTRLLLKTAWYDVTRQEWEQTYTDNNTQQTQTIGVESADDSLGPLSGNQPLRYEVQADNSTTGLVLKAGSAAMVVQGKSGSNVRVKSKRFEGTISNTDTYEPVRAFRLDPNRNNINIQLENLQALSYTVDATVDILFQTFSSANVTFGGGDSWSTPNEWNSENSPIQTRTDVSDVVDSTGTSGATVSDPGGIQIGFATLTPTNGQKFQKGVSSEGRERKANVAERDVLVALVQSGSTGTVEYIPEFELDF